MQNKVLEKKVKVQYMLCKKANVSVPCSEHEHMKAGGSF